MITPRQSRFLRHRAIGEQLDREIGSAPAVRQPCACGHSIDDHRMDHLGFHECAALGCPCLEHKDPPENKRAMTLREISGAGAD